MSERKELSGTFWNYLGSALLISLSGCLGVLVDGIIVGNLINSDGVSAINLNTPVVQFLATISMLIAAGGGMLVGYALGKRDVGQARHIYTQSMIGSMVVGLCFTFMGIFIPGATAGFLCSNEVLLPMVTDYLRVLMLGAPVYMLMWGLSTMIGVDGSPRLASVAIIIDNIVNLILDVVFIKLFDMGITGSSLATVVGHLVAIAIMLTHFRKGTSQLKLQMQWNNLSVWKDIISQGLPLAVASICLTLLLFTSNKVVLAIAGSVGIFVFSVCMNLLQIYNLFLAGVSRSLQTLGSVLIGKKDYEGFRYILGKSFSFITVAMIITCAYVWVFPESLARMFGAENEALVEACNKALRIFALSFIPFCYIYTLMIVYKLLGENGMSLMVSFMLSLTIIPVLGIIAWFAPKYLWYSYLIAYIIEMVVIAAVHKLKGVNLRKFLYAQASMVK